MGTGSREQLSCCHLGPVLGLVSPSQPQSEDIRAEREWPGQWLVAALPHLDTHNTAENAASVGDNATDNI